MMSNSEIRKLSWNQLRKTYWMVFLALLIISVVESLTATIAVGFIIAGPLSVGFASYALDIIINDADGNALEKLLDGFKNNFATSFVAFLVSNIFIFLWSLLLFIPGIIKAYAYSQVYFIIQENPEMSPMDAITESRKMMSGNKFKLFALDFSFIGWFILGALAFGVGILFVIPYHQMARANFYDQLRARPKTELFEEPVFE